MGAAQLELTSFKEAAGKTKQALEGQVLDKEREVDALKRQLKDNTGSSAAEMARLQAELELMKARAEIAELKAANDELQLKNQKNSAPERVRKRVVFDVEVLVGKVEFIAPY